jgi:hypothetical protein
MFGWHFNIIGDIPTGWDGKFKAKPLSPGVYIYIKMFLASSNPIVEINGEITMRILFA